MHAHELRRLHERDALAREALGFLGRSPTDEHARPCLPAHDLRGDVVELAELLASP